MARAAHRRRVKFTPPHITPPRDPTAAGRRLDRAFIPRRAGDSPRQSRKRFVHSGIDIVTAQSPQPIDVEQFVIGYPRLGHRSPMASRKHHKSARRGDRRQRRARMRRQSDQIWRAGERKNASRHHRDRRRRSSHDLSPKPPTIFAAALTISTRQTIATPANSDISNPCSDGP